jgi:ATP-dependent exoDNAse (exonuclease V) alpha subunit
MIVLNNWQTKAEETILNDLREKYKEGKKKITTFGTFIPGPPGTGKTTMINDLIPKIKKEFPTLQIDITATTGAAATRLEKATTLASWLQVGGQAMKLDKYDEIMEVISQRNPERIKNCDILVVDEASMLSHRSWGNLNSICQTVRKKPIDFGGIYVIVLGDPLQLPPVPHDSGFGFGRLEKQFVASCLEREYPGYNYVVANQMMRAEDKNFMKSLLKLVSQNPQHRRDGINEFRSQCYTTEMSIDQVLDFQEEKGYLILTPVKEEQWSCAAYNGRSKKRAEENENSLVIKIKDVQQYHKTNDETLFSKVGGKKALELEEKAIKEREGWTPIPEVRTKQTYMIRANFITPEGISVCNGDTGEILEYDEGNHSMKFKLYRKEKEITIGRKEFKSEWLEEISFEGMPLIPSTAITIHKAQGATVDGVILDPRRFWAEEYLPQKLYTAFSRVRNMKDIKISSYLFEYLLDPPNIQTKLEYIWSIPYMEDYLTPETV